MTSERRLRIAILWKQMTSYWTACFRALAEQGVDIHLVYRSPHPDAPYDPRSLDGGFAGHCWDSKPNPVRLASEIDGFAPDMLLVASWDVGSYRGVARAMRGRTLRILGMDNQWLATPKQWGGIAISPVAIRPCFDAVFLPAERQAQFARHLGFGDDRTLWGFYTCDYEAYAAVTDGSKRRAFVYAGRLVAEKGVKVLANAYRRYRSSAPDPWPLIVCGTGPLADRLAGVPGTDMRGFVQPADLPSVFAEAACLVLPSIFEPWGVVVHEAAAAGLAVVCTTAVGASSRLVVDGYNGAVVPPGDAAALTAAVAEIAAASSAEVAEFGRRSRELARQFTPQRWARYLVDRGTGLRRAMGLTVA